MTALEPGHVIVINRYGPSVAPYPAYLDHERLTVTYISVPSAVRTPLRRRPRWWPWRPAVVW